MATYYQPAKAVGGDFYDFIELPDGLIGLVCGDVTGKGVPAALVMATTHSILRGDAPQFVSPSKVLERANNLLLQDIPPQMFVTCLYGVLDPSTGRLRYANAGHNPPYVHTRNGVVELRATGMRWVRCRHDLRGKGDDAGSRRHRAAAQRRPGREPTIPSARCSASRGWLSS